MQELHVALVENDASLNRAYARLLRAQGCRVDAFLSAEAFLAAGLHPACLVLDVDLDGMSGLALQRHLRAGNSLLPIIFITGGDTAEAEQQAHAQGCHGFIRKPFGGAQLHAAISEAVHQAVASTPLYQSTSVIPVDRA
jgi:FixJ family two-component response regulator